MEVHMKEDSGTVPFVVMCVVIAFLFVACIICPLVITGFSKQPYALPLMATGLLLPFVHFFIFGGMALARKGKE